MNNIVRQLYSNTCFMEQNVDFDILLKDKAIQVRKQKENNRVLLYKVTGENIPEFLSVCCKIDIAENLSEYQKEDMPKINVEFSIEQTSSAVYEKSESVPNLIGLWEIGLSVKVPDNTTDISIFFVFPTYLKTVELKDIRITETDGIIAPFGKKMPSPYMEEKSPIEIRKYDQKLTMDDKEFLEYLEYIVLNKYSFDIKKIDELDIRKKHRFLYDLFAHNEVKLENDDLSEIVHEFDNDIIYRIVEKLILIKKIDVAEYIFQCIKKTQTTDSFLRVVLEMTLLSFKKKRNEARELFEKTDLGELSLSKSDLAYIISPGDAHETQSFFALKWISKNLTEIQRRASLYEEKNKKIDKKVSPIFTFWAQGIDESPVIVKKCINQMKTLYGHRLHILTADNMNEYAFVPFKKNIEKWGHTSEILRTELLMRYGGTWLDSTVLVGDEFLSLQNKFDSIIPKYPPQNRHLGIWCLYINETYNYFYSMLYAALCMYLDLYGDFTEYYMYHVFVRSIVCLDKKARAFFDNAYPLNATNAAYFASPKNQTTEMEKEDFFLRLKKSPVHKLTYKYNLSQITEKSILSLLLKYDFNDVKNLSDNSSFSERFIEKNKNRDRKKKANYVILTYPSGNASMMRSGIIREVLENHFDDVHVIMSQSFWESDINTQVNEIASFFTWGKNDYVIFMPAVLIPQYLPPMLVDSLKKIGAITILYNIDAMQAVARRTNLSVYELNRLYIKNGVDRVYTYNLYEARKYGYAFQMSPLYHYPGISGTHYDEAMVFFCGRSKGRLSLLNRIAKKLKSHGIKYNFYILESTIPKHEELDENFHLIKYVSYEQVVGWMRKATCLLSIGAQNTGFVTAAYSESIMYNKILLADYQFLDELPYYNNSYMRSFNDENDIDYDWLKNNKIIDYHYKNEFSFRKFLDRIDKDFDYYTPLNGSFHTDLNVDIHYNETGWKYNISNGCVSMEGNPIEAIRVNSNDIFEIRFGIKQKNSPDWIYESSKSFNYLGQTGKSLPINGVFFDLIKQPGGYTLFYRVYVDEIGWTRIYKSGEYFQGDGNKRLFGLQLWLSQNE